MILEIGSISLLIYILFKQNGSLSDLVFSFVKRDVLHSFVIAFLAMIANYIAYYLLTFLSVWFFGNGLPEAEFQTVFHSVLTIPLLLFVMINPFFEELIVRAYLITEVEFFSNSTLNAGLFSLFIQISYHLYQGISNSLTMIGMFSVFTIYYTKKRRIWPIILAHAYFDLYAYCYYFLFRP